MATKPRASNKNKNGTFCAFSQQAKKNQHIKIPGTLPNIARNVIINIGEIVVYDVTKDALISNGLFKDGIPCHFTSAVVAGFCATIIASPVDVIKTR